MEHEVKVEARELHYDAAQKQFDALYMSKVMKNLHGCNKTPQDASNELQNALVGRSYRKYPNK